MQNELILAILTSDLLGTIRVLDANRNFDLNSIIIPNLQLPILHFMCYQPPREHTIPTPRHVILNFHLPFEQSPLFSTHDLTTIVNLFLNYPNRPDINLKDTWGFSPVDFAIARGHIEIVQSLLNNGADIFQKERELSSIYVWATTPISREIATLIHSAKCQVLLRCTENSILFNGAPIFESNIELLAKYI